MYLERGIVVIVDNAKLYENKVVTNPAVHSSGNRSGLGLTTPGAPPFELREHSSIAAGLRLIHAGNARLSRHHVVPVRRVDESKMITPPRERVLNVRSRHGSVGHLPHRSVVFLNSLGINLPLAEKAFLDEKPPANRTSISHGQTSLRNLLVRSLMITSLWYVFMVRAHLGQ